MAVLLEYVRGSNISNTAPPAQLFDGLGRPYGDSKKARWYFLAWLFRDAPAQRLGPILSSVEGNTIDERRARLLNELREFVAPLFPLAESWTWPVMSEIMIDRLEGSRRSIKGTLFEGIVRSNLHQLFSGENVVLTIENTQVTLNDETYDVKVAGTKGSLLLPVKTRETMGGGHAHLFTRDIHKAIRVAHENGYNCIPIVIAESWGGDLDSLACEHYVYIQANPNQVQQITPMLTEKMKQLLPIFKALE